MQDVLNLIKEGLINLELNIKNCANINQNQS
jgi:hypothetical protein